jgi:thiol-disulfide isomerase/thioredoxin
MRHVLCLSLLLAACAGAASTAERPPVATGAPAPALSGAALSGEAVDLAALRGQVVLVDFWASWCAPCRRELPELDALYRRHRAAGLMIIGVNLDEQRADAEAFLRDAVAVSFPVLHDPAQALAGAWSPPKMPTLYVIDRAGRIVRVFDGEKPGQLAALHAEVERLLGS